MAVSNITPASGATLNYAESFSFEVTDPYTSLLVRVTVSGGALEAAYDDGVAAGYTVTIEDLGATHKVTVKRDAGWSIDPMTVYVTENDTTTTNWTYDIFPTQEYPEGMQPYNDVATGAAGYGVNSFEGRTGNVVSALNDYDASEVNNDSSVTGATVKDALETLDAYSAPVDSVHGRTGAVVAATSDYDASQIDNDSGVAGATVKDALDALDARDEGQVDLKNKVSSPTIATQEDWNRYHGSVARVNGGGTITDDGDGTVTVSAGYGLIRATDSNTAVFYKVDWAETPITPTDGQLNFIYLEWNAGTPQMVVTTTKRTDLNTNIYMGSVHRSGTFLHPTTHVTPTGNVSAKLTKRFNDTEGLTRAAGSVTTEVGTRNVAITQGTWWHGLDEQTIAAVDTSVADTITTFYRDGVGGWTATGGVTQIPNDFYDDGSGTLQALSANRYGVYWLYVGVDNHTYMIYGRGDYTSSQWPDAIPPGDIPPHMQEQHSGIVARIVVQKGDTVFTDLVVPWDTAFTSSGVQEHHDLGGLTDDDHTQYVLGAGTRAQDALYLAERADHVNTPGAGFGELWLFNDVEQELRFTDDQGDDYKVATFSGSSPASNYVPVGFDNHGAGRLESSLLKYNAGELYLGDATGSLRMNERTTGPTPVAGDGYFWVRDGTDQNPMFTNDASEDIGLDLWELGSWNFNASTIGTPGVAEFDTNNAAITLTTTIRVTTTGNNEGQSRAWLEDLNNGYLLMKKRDNPYEEVQFKVTAGADVAGAWADLTVAWQDDSTADVNWATADQWT
nr:hypothetical protein [Thermoplasmata archaeon]NIY01891.1 hypothetical protein [Thermoplasmata archaeon]